MKLPGWQPSVSTQMPKKEAVLQTTVAQRDFKAQQFIPTRNPNDELRLGLAKASSYESIGKSVTGMVNTGIEIYDSVQTAEAEAKANAIVQTLSDYVGEATTKMPAVAIDDQGKEYVPAESLRDDYDQVLKQLITHHTDDKKFGTRKAQASFSTILSKATTKHRDEIRTFTQDSLIAKGYADTVKTLEAARTEDGVDLAITNAVSRRFMTPQKGMEMGIKYKKKVRFNGLMGSINLHGLSAARVDDDDFDSSEEGLMNQVRSQLWEMDKEQFNAAMSEIRAIRTYREARLDDEQEDAAIDAEIGLLDGSLAPEEAVQDAGQKYGKHAGGVVSQARGNFRNGVDDANEISAMDTVIDNYLNQDLHNGKPGPGMYTFKQVKDKIQDLNDRGLTTTATHTRLLNSLRRAKRDEDYRERKKQAFELLDVALNGMTEKERQKRGIKDHKDHIPMMRELQRFIEKNPRADFLGKVEELTAGKTWAPITLFNNKGQSIDTASPYDPTYVESTLRAATTMNARWNAFVSTDNPSQAEMQQDPAAVRLRFLQWWDAQGYQDYTPVAPGSKNFLPDNGWLQKVEGDMKMYQSQIRLQ